MPLILNDGPFISTMYALKVKESRAIKNWTRTQQVQKIEFSFGFLEDKSGNCIKSAYFEVKFVIWVI